MQDREAQLLIVELSKAEDTIKRDAIRVFVGKERSLKFNKEIETNLGMRYQDNATNKLVIWKSTNTRIATVNQIDISNWSNQNGSKEGKEMSLS